jgi:hypothetical protein
VDQHDNPDCLLSESTCRTSTRHSTSAEPLTSTRRSTRFAPHPLRLLTFNHIVAELLSLRYRIRRQAENPQRMRHTGIRIEEMLELTHHSFVAYTLPTTGEVVPMLQVAPSKTDAERLLLVSPELAEVLTAIIFRVRAGNAAL